MKTRKVTALAWTALCLAILLLMVTWIIMPKIHMGTDITFKTGDRTSTIDFGGFESAKMEAASSKFFFLRKATGEIVTGLPVEKPLGWEDESYFRVGPVDISSGQWIIEYGYNVTIHVIAETSMNIAEDTTHGFKIISGAITLVCLLGIWFVIFVLILWHGTKKPS